jgi:hypothetical protein
MHRLHGSCLSFPAQTQVRAVKEQLVTRAGQSLALGHLTRLYSIGSCHTAEVLYSTSNCGYKKFFTRTMCFPIHGWVPPKWCHPDHAWRCTLKRVPLSPWFSPDGDRLGNARGGIFETLV